MFIPKELWVFKVDEPETIGRFLDFDPENPHGNILIQWDTHASWHYPEELQKMPEA